MYQIITCFICVHVDLCTLLSHLSCMHFIASLYVSIHPLNLTTGKIGDTSAPTATSQEERLSGCSECRTPASQTPSTKENRQQNFADPRILPATTPSKGPLYQAPVQWNSTSATRAWFSSVSTWNKTFPQIISRSATLQRWRRHLGRGWCCGRRGVQAAATSIPEQ